MQLNELFNKTYNWRWGAKSNVAFFNTDDGGEVIVSFYKLHPSSPNYEVGFTKNDSIRKTGEGDQFKIISTVLDVIKTFLENNPKTEVLTFTAKREGKAAEDPKHKNNRAELYKRMLGRFAKQHNYEFAWDDVGRMTEFVLRRLDVDETNDLNEVNIDNVKGAGAVPYNQEVDYFGMKVMMRPSQFLKLAAPLNGPPSQRMVKYITDGGAIGAPFLIIKVPENMTLMPEVIGHEGRNRMAAIKQVEGDSPIEVHLLFQGVVNRSRHLTPEIKTYLNNGMHQEMTHNIVNGPLWHTTIAESQNIKPKTNKSMNRNLKNNIAEDIKKPHPKDTLGIKRADMPQVHKDHYPELIKYLESHGGKLRLKTVHAHSLKPVQSEFSDEGVEKMMSKAGNANGTTRKKPLIVSADNYIVDGHHRWLASYNLDEDVPIMQFNIPIKKLMQLIHDFEHTTYRDIYNEGKIAEINTVTLDKDMGNLDAFANQVKQKYGLKTFWLSNLEERNAIELSQIIVDKDKQKQGSGTGAMKELVNFADQHGKIIVLDPALIDKRHGTTSQSRLRKFYSRFGFINNKGRNKNYEFRQLMIRYPNVNENMSVTGTDRQKEEQQNKLKPGSDAWFAHWFSRPLMTREDVNKLKEDLAQTINEFKEIRNEKTSKQRRSNCNRRTNESSRNRRR